jgi:hypothetical protein
MKAPVDKNAEVPKRPAFLITIDTEGDNIWDNPSEIKTENSRFLPRFQELCEKYGLKPTYLTNYEMARSDRFVDFARDAVERGMAEVGMHLHAWNSPPVGAGPSREGMPYLIEFPEPVMRDKVKVMTELLEGRVGKRPVSHRAGRWAFNEAYAKILIDEGYTTDCSVTPHVSWRATKGFADGDGGSDYRGFPTEPYFVDPNAISRTGTSRLLEVPMTIVANSSVGARAARSASKSLPQPVTKVVNRIFPSVSWFRPNGRNLGSMLRLLRRRSRSSYIEFMLHSSELMPGGSPTFRTERSIDQLYAQLEQIFAAAENSCLGATLGEFREAFEGRAGQAV